MSEIKHQYVERHSGRIVPERLYGDRIIRFLYSSERESPQRLYGLLTGARVSSLLGFINFDVKLGGSITGLNAGMRAWGIDLGECVEAPSNFRSARDVFERKIRYWECRPMDEEASSIVSPADARVLAGSLETGSPLFLKGKFFDLEELLGADKPRWLEAFRDGDFAVFRLTPDKYHYNHTPVAGRVVDFYEIPGCYHSCNPGAVVAVATPYSKNKRTVTILDTDVPRGSGVGLVAMIEVVALMIGDVVQCYSEEGYEAPRPLAPGMFVKKGMPKSLYRPGSSTDVLLFQRGRVDFAEDIIRNMYRPHVESCFSIGFGRPLVETDVKVRSHIATVRG
jgi:phosphatidylserine decarboxylase